MLVVVFDILVELAVVALVHPDQVAAGAVAPVTVVVDSAKTSPL